VRINGPPGFAQKANHESTKGRKHEKEEKNQGLAYSVFFFSSFRAFVMELL
jgi:hypothetical protein